MFPALVRPQPVRRIAVNALFEQCSEAAGYFKLGQTCRVITNFGKDNLVLSPRRALHIDIKHGQVEARGQLFRAFKKQAVLVQERCPRF